MKPISLFSYQTRLIWWCLLPLLALSVFLSIQFIRESKEISDRNAVEMVNNAALAIDDEIHDQIAALNMLAASPLAESASDWEKLYQEALAFRNHFSGHVIFLDPSMQMRFDTRVPFGTTLPMLVPEGRAAAQAVIQTAQPSVSDIFSGPVAKEKSVSVVVPVIRDGHVRSLLLSIMEINKFPKSLDRIALPAEWSLTIYDGNKEVMATRLYSSQDPSSHRKGDSDRYVVKSAFSQWSVVLDLPVKTRNANIFKEILICFLAITAATLISVFIGRISNKKLSHQISSITKFESGAVGASDIVEIEGVRQWIAKTIENLKQSESIIRKSNDKLRLSTELANVAVWEYSFVSNTMERSGNHDRLYGLEWQDVWCMDVFLKATHPDDRKASRDAIIKSVAVNGPDQYSFDFRVIYPDGSIHWLMVTGQVAERDEKGQGRIVRGCLIDITKRKKAEIRIKDEQLFISAITETMPAVIYLYDLTTHRNLYTNSALEALLGYSPEEVKRLGSNLLASLIHPDDMADVMKFQTRIMAARDNEILEIEYRVKHKNGNWITLRSYERPFKRDDTGLVQQKIGIAIDATERRQAEERLHKSEQIVSTVTDLLALIDTEYTYLFANQAYLDAMGRKSEELVGKTVVEMLGDDAFNHKIFPRVQQCLSGKTIRFQEWFEFPAIGNRYMDIFYSPYRGYEEGLIKGYVVTARDITDYENLKAQLLQAQKMESVGRLAGGVAHDFNNMLSIILGNSEIIVEEIGSEHPCASSLKEIQNAAQRSANLTRQLLAFARKQTISPKVINPNRIIEGILKMLKRLIGEDIDLLWHPQADLWPIKIDPSQIDQILANLCVNARDAIKDVGKITIETGNVHFDDSYCVAHAGFIPGEYVFMGVSDNGSGMGQETLNLLFEPFFTTKKKGEGTGLGLATVYGIVKQNNGFINVYSEPDQGTTFKIYLPRYSGDSEEKAEKEVPKESRKGTETILLVEDNASILQMAKQLLEKLGYIVLAANTPDEALQISNDSNTAINLLMTDVVMPAMNGRELAEKILSAFPNMKILYMSGYTANVIAHRGILDEGLNFINKPFSKQELSEKLREILD